MREHPNLRAATTLVLVFLAGAISGALTMRYTPTARAAVRSGPSLKLGNKEIFLQRFKKELNLTPEQTKDVAAALEDFNMYYQTLQDQLDDVRSTGKSRILQILDAGQRVKFEKILSESQSK